MHTPPPRVRHEIRALHQDQLNQDPFLTYKGETDHFYRVQTRCNRFFTVHKNRNALEPFPYADSWPLHTPFRWLGLSFLGLLTAGLATLIFAPLTLISALRVNRDSLCEKDVAKLKIIVGSTAILWLVGTLLAALFILHL